jgi:hypothetical protein
MSLVLLLLLLPLPLPFLQVMLVVEALVSSLPPCPALVDLLLLLCQRHPSDSAWQEWLLQLLVPICYSSSPVASGSAWVQLVEVMGRRSPSSADRLCREGLRVHPWNLGLWRAHVAAAGERHDPWAGEMRLRT